jgi:hypothetical protein
LKFRLKILADWDPLLNCHNFCAPGTENTLTTVPLSEAVASIVPVEFSAKAAIGALCACITFNAVLSLVSNKRTSPVVGAGAWGGIADNGEEEDVGAGDG